MTLDLSNKIDAKTAAKLIDVSPNTILVYAKSGKLAHIRRGARFFFDETDVLALIKIVEPHNAQEQLA